MRATEAVSKEEALRWAQRLFGLNVAAIEVWFASSTERCQFWLLYDYGGGRLIGAGGNWHEAVTDSCRARREHEAEKRWGAA